ncbi:MAG: hypothetical protein IJ530_12530 [Treponema sp.]|uniref:hypothetical protein n=1 Tax=Treponema sp. TaxID=166 RepID=UPI0025DD4193|nr:hypothetical protein [Treponema sp.]MBQ8680567.1 hypothetical protein [Treponema sp.]
MKALLVADDEKAINNISEVLKSAGYDTIVYKWLLKALDNIEEIAPHLIVVSTADYPRHWKTLAQYASSGFGDYLPQVILYTDENFNEEEQKKAQALHVRGTFDSVEVEGLDTLREILAKTDDIFSGYLTEEEQKEISVDDLVPNAEKFVDAKIEESNESVEKEDSFDELVTKFEETNEESEDFTINEQTFDEIEEAQMEAEGDAKAADRLEEISADEKAADRLEEISGDEEAADKLERITGNEEIPTVSDIINDTYDESESTTLPGEDELKRLLAENNFAEKSEEVFEESESNDIIEKVEENSPMADEQNIEEKLAAIMNANRADQKEKAEALKLDTGTSSVSFVFTNPITLAMVSGVARNYNGLVLEFTPDIPSFILNLSPGTKIGIASMKIDDKIENVFAEVMSNDAKKLALAIKK